MTKTEKRVCLGAVVGVHGIKGEVKVKSFTAVDTDIDRYGPVEDKSGLHLQFCVTGLCTDLSVTFYYPFICGKFFQTHRTARM